MKKDFFYKLLIAFLVLIFLITCLTLFRTYRKIYYPNVVTHGNPSEFIYIPTGASFEEVMDTLCKNNYIIDKGSFEWMAEKKNYKNNISPGRYRIKNNMSNNELINILRSGKQDPVKLTINKTRTMEILAGRLSKKIEADSLSLISAFRDNELLAPYGFNSQTVAAMIIPNTYKFFWNTSAKQFAERMYKEYQIFWTEERKAKAAEINMTPLEVTILASIVTEETARSFEDPIVAGVYINRLNKGMKLQADPTVKFAIGDFSLKRILLKHLEYDSPYNTYVYKGLPPSPICIPEPACIDAVLNYQHHSYLYFCAKDDLSGTHAFAKTLVQHIKNAQAYQRALDKQKIWK
jgi:UPF0755 protein